MSWHARRSMSGQSDAQSSELIAGRVCIHLAHAVCTYVCSVQHVCSSTSKMLCMHMHIYMYTRATSRAMCGAAAERRPAQRGKPSLSLVNKSMLSSLFTLAQYFKFALAPLSSPPRRAFIGQAAAVAVGLQPFAALAAADCLQTCRKNCGRLNYILFFGTSHAKIAMDTRLFDGTRGPC